MWPDYLKRETLARRLNLAPGAVDQYVKRGLLPEPIAIGEALLWRWADVDAHLQALRLAGHTAGDETHDPYTAGIESAHAAERAAKTSTPRPTGPQSGRA